jgi:hypothetical protein
VLDAPGPPAALPVGVAPVAVRGLGQVLNTVETF